MLSSANILSIKIRDYSTDYGLISNWIGLKINGSLFSQGVKQVLVKLGAKGSVLFTVGEEPIKQGIISAPKVVDTTGAGDTFTAAFAVALVEGNPKKECLKFAGKFGVYLSTLSQ